MTQQGLNRQAFYEEASDLLSELETALLELEATPADQELIDRVFRAMHTIKGSGSMFGFDNIAAFTHDVESVFEHVRNGDLEVSRELLDLTLKSRDHIAYLLSSEMAGEEPDLSRAEPLTAGLRALVPEALREDDAGKRRAQEEDTASLEQATLSVRFRPHQDFFHYGNNPLALLDELADLGAAHCFPHLEDVPPLEELDPASCHLWWDVIVSGRADEQAVHDVFLFAEDECDLHVRVIDRGDGLEEPEDYKKLGEILVDRGDITAEDLRTILDERKRIGNLLAETGKVSEERIVSALQEQKAVRQIRAERTTRQKPQEQASSIRVAADKLDYLVDLVGELVTVQAQISQMVASRQDAQFLALAEELERLSDELRDSTLNIRMLPIGTTFSKFRRLVRDLSTEMGKQIELQTRGAETELDKTVIERLNDPLVHLLRNSIDHGIESPEIREAAGKDPSGIILLTAEHSGGEVLIRIEDDGKGIDAEVIRAKAVERGLLSPDVELNKGETLALIFMPGFSTAEKVTNVSGRGVGMDVVKRSIDELRGSVSIESEKGQGTVITIKLPLTLAIIEGLQIQVEDEFYVMPLSIVEECVELIRAELHNTEEQIVNLRGEIVPYIRLRESFEVSGVPPEIEQIVVTNAGGMRVGIVVDHVIGEHQTVIKTLGKIYKNVEGISGATIRGDGTLALILDVPQLVHAVVGGRIRN
jgi:two-component system, chemotaxis family, sensor kinase CheA